MIKREEVEAAVFLLLGRRHGPPLTDVEIAKMWANLKMFTDTLAVARLRASHEAAKAPSEPE